MSMKETYPDVYQDLMRRMRRIEGQARGIQRLLDENADCDDIVIQLAAMKAAVSRVAVKVAACQLTRRMAEELQNGGTGRTAMDELMDTFLKI